MCGMFPMVLLCQSRLPGSLSEGHDLHSRNSPWTMAHRRVSVPLPSRTQPSIIHFDGSSSGCWDRGTLSVHQRCSSTGSAGDLRVRIRCSTLSMPLSKLRPGRFVQRSSGWAKGREPLERSTWSKCTDRDRSVFDEAEMVAFGAYAARHCTRSLSHVGKNLWDINQIWAKRLYRDHCTHLPQKALTVCSTPPDSQNPFETSKGKVNDFCRSSLRCSSVHRILG